MACDHKADAYPDRKYTISFGRVGDGLQGGRRSRWQLVGREGQRAFLIDRLIHMGRSGAFLITGRRGVGKTSFVQYCLSMYEDDVLSRFRRSNLARSFFAFAYLIFFFVLIVTATFAAHAVSEQLWDTIPAWDEISGGDEQVTIRITMQLVVAILITVAFLIPLIIAKSHVETLFGASRRRDRANLAVLFSVAIISLVILFLDADRPDVFAFRSIFILSVISLWTSACSFGKAYNEQENVVTWFPVEYRRVIVFTLFLHVVEFLSRNWSIYYSDFGLMPLPYLSYGEEKSLNALSTINIYSLLSIVCLIFGKAIRLFNQAWLARMIEMSSLVKEGFDEKKYVVKSESYKEKIFLDIGVLILYFIAFFTFLYFVDDNFEGIYNNLIFLTGISLFFVIILLYCFYSWGRSIQKSNLRALVHEYRCDPSSEHHRSNFLRVLRSIQGNEIRPRTIICAKIFILFGLGLHLIVSSFYGGFDGKIDVYIRWGIGLVLLASLLFILEYENILRPLIKQLEETTIADRLSWPFADFVRLGPTPNPSDKRDDETLGDADDNETEPPQPYETDEASSDVRRERAFALAQMTLPWLIFRLSLPTIIVSINLGFSKMDHRSVVQAMGMELRRRYYRSFVAWNAPIANIHRFVQVLLLLFFVKALGSAWFEPIRPYNPSAPTSATIDPWQYRSLVGDSDRLRCEKLGVLGLESEATRVLCGMPGGEFVVALLNFDILKLTATGDSGLDGNRDRRLLDFVLHRSDDLDQQIRDAEEKRVCSADRTLCKKYGWGNEAVKESTDDYSFRGYHLFLLIALTAFWRWISDFVPIFPYRRNLRQLDDLLDSLSSSRTENRDRPMWAPARWVRSLFTDTRNQQLSSEPLDPRTIEQAFMALLEDMQSSQINLPFGDGVPLTSAGPEITFVFDELDKLTGMANVETSTEVAYDQDATVLAAERERVRMLYALLSDLKRIITNSPARFLFIGGRLLHEKWLADKTTRNPLLSSIFDGEIYIPALMNDHPLGYPHRWHSRTRQLLYLTHQRANEADEVHKRYNWSGIFNLPIQQSSSVRFLNEDLRKIEKSAPPSTMRFAIVSQRFDPPAAFEPAIPSADPYTLDFEKRLKDYWCDILIDDFVYFLTYRSGGNPKRLRELLNGFVRHTNRVFRDDDATRWCEAKSRHVLHFGGADLHRLQLISRLYQHIAHRFERHLLSRDDKNTTVIFYLSDFLFKFHRRAFDWHNLERVEELAHIHRAPDIRNSIQDLVDCLSETHIAYVLNGMYAFRFRTEESLEIQYLSRFNEEEMAYFNFTLDESQSLKTYYNQVIGEHDAPNYEMIAALGELHEYDQDYEQARHHYLKAVAELDRSFESSIGALQFETAGDPIRYPALIGVMNSRTSEHDNIQIYFSWAKARLRLMLQIGMTYELARDFTKALTAYSDARSFSSAVLARYHDEVRYRDDTFWNEDRTLYAGRHFNEPKHLNIFYQPYLASAWIVEKLPYGIDTSATLIEQELEELFERWPFVWSRKIDTAKSPSRVRDSNFALIAAELANKAGDIYFFKGRQITSLEETKKLIAEGQFTYFRDRPFDRDDELKEHKLAGPAGFLIRSHYFYSLALHQLRNYMYARIASSPYKIHNTVDDKEGGRHRPRWMTMLHGQWPEFFARTAANSLVDLGEEMLGRFTFFGMLTEVSNPKGPIEMMVHEEQEDGNQGDEPGALDGAVRSDHSQLSLSLRRWFERHAEPLSEFGIIDWTRNGPKLGMPLHVDFEKRTPTKEDSQPTYYVNLGSWDDWFGHWHGWDDVGDGQKPPLIDFRSRSLETTSNPLKRLLFSLHMQLSGADFLDDWGYHGDAARELVKICESVNHYLWWALFLDDVLRWGGLEDGGAGRPSAGGVNWTTYAWYEELKNCFDDRRPFAFAKSTAMSVGQTSDSDPAAPHERQLRFWLYQIQIVVTCLERVSDYKEQSLTPDGDGNFCNERARNFDELVGKGEHAPRGEGDDDDRLRSYPASGQLTSSIMLQVLSVAMALERIRHHVGDDGKSDDRSDAFRHLRWRIGRIIATWDDVWLKQKDKTPNSADVGSAGTQEPADCGSSRYCGVEGYYAGDEPIESFECLRLCLERWVEVSRYPVINRIQSMRVLAMGLTTFAGVAEEEALRGSGEAYRREAKKWLENTNKLEDHFNYPNFSGPLDTAVMYSWYWLYHERFFKAGELRKDNNVFIKIMKDKSSRARQLITMGKAYYENIANNYYLYDDFNDRTMHHGHAITMAGANIIALIDEICDGNKESRLSSKSERRLST